MHGGQLMEVIVPLPDVKRDHVELIDINKPGKDKFNEVFTDEVISALQYNSINNVIWWVGHDLRTGHLAASLKKRLNNGRLALINHMSYQHYESLTNDPDDADLRVNKQRELFLLADHVFTIGPVLYQAMERKVGNRGIKVTQLIPGLADIKPESPSQEFKAITYGRYNIVNDYLKQIRLGTHAFAEAVQVADIKANYFPGELPHQPHIYIIGVDLNVAELQEFRTEVYQKAGKLINLWPLKYSKNRDEIFDKLKECSVAMMLSWHEGFGLAGWEMISAEVPLILSQQSGLWKYISQRCGGLATGLVKVINVKGSFQSESGENYSKEDLLAVKEAILEIASDVTRAKKNASDLKDLLLNPKLGDVCTWENTIRTFLSALGMVEHQNSKNPFRLKETGQYASPEIKKLLINCGLTSFFAIDNSIRLIELNLNGQLNASPDSLKVESKFPSDLEIVWNDKFPSKEQLELSIHDYHQEVQDYITKQADFYPSQSPAEWKIGVAFVRKGVEIFDEITPSIIIRPLNYRVTNVFNRQIVIWKNAVLAGTTMSSEELENAYAIALSILLSNSQTFNFQAPSQLFVEMAILSNDNNIILVKKDKAGPSVVASLGMSWTCGPEVGLTFKHLNDDETINLNEAIVDSLKIEFGITEDKIMSWHISGMALQTIHLNTALYGYCTINLTGKEICKTFMERKSTQFIASETGAKPYPELYHVDDLRSILNEDERYDGDRWHPTAKIRLYSILNN
jgi:hypothetical protein